MPKRLKGKGIRKIQAGYLRRRKRLEKLSQTMEEGIPELLNLFRTFKSDLLVPQPIDRATGHGHIVSNTGSMEETTKFEKDGDKEEEIEVPETGTWVIPDAAYRGTKCLHIVGSCHRVPGVHYKLWTPVADPVCESLFKKVCKVCFPEGYPWEGIIVDDDVEQEVELGMLATQADGSRAR